MTSLMDCVIIVCWKKRFSAQHVAPVGFLFSWVNLSSKIHHTHHVQYSKYNKKHKRTQNTHCTDWRVTRFSAPWQMWPLAVMVNPKRWVWYKQDLAITMILTSVSVPLQALQPRRNNRVIFLCFSFLITTKETSINRFRTWGKCTRN